MARNLMCCAVVLCCVIFEASIVHGVPVKSDRRVSRDLDQIDGLRARLIRLQKQIDALETKSSSSKTTGTRATAATDDANQDDVSKELQSVSESQMTSKRQQNVQRLAKKLDADNDEEIQLLAQTLNQLLAQPEVQGGSDVDRTNTAGEYLGDRYNEASDQSLPTLASGRRVDDDDNTGDESDAGKETEVSRIRTIYNMLVRAYDLQQQQQKRASSSSRSSLQQRDASSAVSSRYRQQVPGGHTDEGTFGEFVDDAVSNRATSAPRAGHSGMREAVLAAIEDRLLRDVEDARGVGISVDDIIRDLHSKDEVMKQGRERAIERKLKEMSGGRS